MAGLSMGSMQTSIVTMKHPDMFGYAGVFSGFVGPFNKTNAENSYIQLLDDRENSHSPLECFSVLAETKILLRSSDLKRIVRCLKKRACACRKLDTCRKMYPGEHEWNVWRMCCVILLNICFMNDTFLFEYR